MSKHETVSFSGRNLDELQIEAALSGELTSEDFRISAATLRLQAKAAKDAGYPQLSENLLRAAELTHISNAEVLEIYNKLRPGRTTHAEMLAIADHLETDANAPLTASFIREAAEVYLKRGIVKVEDG